MGWQESSASWLFCHWGVGSLRRTVLGMVLVLLVLALLVLSLAANRYGADTRDGRDWASSPGSGSRRW